MMMTIFEFSDAVKNGELNDKTIKEKWGNLCDDLRDQEVSKIKEIIMQGALEGLVNVEGLDGFGSEGMRL